MLFEIEKFKVNDILGGGKTFNYKGVGFINPTTLVYIKVASDIRKLFSEDIGEKVAEIGVGYGGQLLIADMILKFKQYDLFDLPPVLELTHRYLAAHILNHAYSLQTINQLREDVKYDLVISNYAFSELPCLLYTSPSPRD